MRVCTMLCIRTQICVRIFIKVAQYSSRLLCRSASIPPKQVKTIYSTLMPTIMYACMYVYVPPRTMLFIRTQICVHPAEALMHVILHEHMYVHIYIYIYIYINTCVCACVSLYASVCMYAYARVYMFLLPTQLQAIHSIIDV